MKFQELQSKIGEWSDETFKESSLEGLSSHLLEETKELGKNPFDVMNYADVLILLMVLARKCEYSMSELEKAVEVKHIINVSRIWLEPDEKGITRHHG